jgi:hypothetical protein
MLSKLERALLIELLHKLQKGGSHCNYDVVSPGTTISTSDIRRFLTRSFKESGDNANTVLHLKTQ